MDIIISMLVTFYVLIFSIYKEIFVGFPLLLGFFTFTFISWRRGFSLRDIIKMSIDGGKKAVVIFISCALAGIFNGTKMLKNIEDILMSAKTRYILFIYILFQ